MKKLIAALVFLGALTALILGSTSLYSQQVINGKLIVKGDVTVNKDFYIAKYPAPDTAFVIVTTAGKVDTVKKASMKRILGIHDTSQIYIYNYDTVSQIDTLISIVMHVDTIFNNVLTTNTIYSIESHVDTIYSITAHMDTIVNRIMHSDTLYSIVIHSDTIFIGNDTLIPHHNHYLDSLINVDSRTKTNGTVLKWSSAADMWVVDNRTRVASVGLTMPAHFLLTNSPITNSGTIGVTYANQTANKVLASPDGSTGIPEYRQIVAPDVSLTNGKFLIGNVSNIAQERTLSSDISVSNTGVVTIQPNAVQGTDINLAGEVLGDLMYFNGVDWVRFPPGTSGMVIKSNGAGNLPTWQTDATGGGITLSPYVVNGVTTATSATNIAAQANMTFNTNVLTIAGRQAINNTTTAPGLYITQSGSSLGLAVTNNSAFNAAYITTSNSTATALAVTAYTGSAINASVTGGGNPAILGESTVGSGGVGVQGKVSTTNGVGVESIGMLQITKPTGTPSYIRFALPTLSGNLTHTLPIYPTSSNDRLLTSTTAGVWSWKKDSVYMRTTGDTAYNNYVFNSANFTIQNPSLLNTPTIVNIGRSNADQDTAIIKFFNTGDGPQKKGLVFEGGSHTYSIVGSGDDKSLYFTHKAGLYTDPVLDNTIMSLIEDNIYLPILPTVTTDTMMLTVHTGLVKKQRIRAIYDTVPFRRNNSRTATFLRYSSDFVGLGTTTPKQKLEVVGNIKVATNGDSALISTYKPASSLGKNVWIGNGGQLSTYISGLDGSYNTSIGYDALKKNTVGASNTAIGQSALQENTSGTNNTMAGFRAGYSNTIGSNNTGVGAYAVNAILGGNYNTGVGYGALEFVYNGLSNSSVGQNALGHISSGSYNVGIGFSAGNLVGNSTTINQTSTYSTYIGYDARGSLDGNTNEMVIGNGARGNGDNTTTIGGASTTDTYLSNKFQVINKTLIDNTQAGTGYDAGSYFDITPGTYGFMAQFVIGDAEDYLWVMGTSAAVVTIIQSGSWVTTNTDGEFCVVDNGSTVRISNAKGATKHITGTVTYNR